METGGTSVLYLNRSWEEMIRHLLAVLLLVGFTGCAGVQITPLPPEKKQMIYPASFDATWRTVLDVLNDWEMPISAIEKESGIVVTDFVVVSAPSDMFPMGQMEIPRAGRYKMNISVREQGKQTIVKVNAHYERFSQILFEPIGTWKPQGSTGQVEANLLNSVLATLIKDKGRIGIQIDDSGIIIQIVSDSPASMAGVKFGDKILKINERPMTNQNEALQEIIGDPGTTVRLLVLRNGEEIEFIIKRQIIK